MKVSNVRVEPQTICIGAITPNNYTMSRTAFSRQSDLFLCIAPCQEAIVDLTFRITNCRFLLVIVYRT